MSPPPSPTAPESRLFDAETLDSAGRSPALSHVRWLCLSQDPEAAHLRRVLEHCWAHAGDSRDTLRKGLMNERWGQHAGARAHLLALGLFLHEGYAVQCEPSLGKQSPDLLVERDGHRTLVEVRAITGCGETPWESEPMTSLGPPPPTGRGGEAGRGNRPSEAARREARGRARKLAAQRTEAARADAAALQVVVARVLERKADAYRDLCAAENLAYLICIYEDTDQQLSGLVQDWAFGHGRAPQAPGQGAFASDSQHLGHVSGVVVFGRLDDEQGRCLIRGDLLVNPCAERPLPTSPPLPHLRMYRRTERASPGAAPAPMGWTPRVAPPFALGPPA